MKLYTEEQVRDILKLARLNSQVYTDDYLIELLTPIQLPTDDEIEEYSHTKYMEVGDSRWFEPIKVGAKWMKSKIQEGNK